MPENNRDTVGGGIKKVIYTLDTVRKIGPLKAGKALNSSNTCKACGLGMGGQLGGMTNELGEFPSVCNKSVQAQSSDIQAGIPVEIFKHPVSELRELSGRELDRLGRLTRPLVKKAGQDHFSIATWAEAMTICVEAFKRATPERSFFYSSGRSSNEAGFIFQLLARIYGTNNISNCSYYCHQATSVGLASTIGTGTATVELADLGYADVIFVIGANPASNHPRYIHQLKKCRDRGGHVIVINPAKEKGLVKFAVPKDPGSILKGGDEIASQYIQPRIGSDVALLLGIAKAVVELGAEDTSFINEYTEGYDAFRDQVEQTPWQTIEELTGVSTDQIRAVAQTYCEAENVVFSWGMGLTHHTNGVENVEYVANLALLRGMIGRPGAGLLPLRGHSNVQGIGTIGVKPVLTKDVLDAMEAEFELSLPRDEGKDTLASLQAAYNGEIDLAFIMGGNLYAATPDASFASAALDNIKTKIFLTTSLNSGHLHGTSGDMVILPVTPRDEEWSATTQESMFNYVRLSDGGIVRHRNVRPESVVLTDLLKGIKPDLPFAAETFKDHRKVRHAIARIVPGMSDLKNIDIAKKEFHIAGRLLHTPRFNTETRRGQFRVSELPTQCVSEEAFPFRLSTIRSEGQFNSIIYEEQDVYRGTKNRWSVLMNHDDIHALGITEGNKVNLRSESGEMLSVEVVEFDIPAGNMMAYYPEANQLTSTTHDPRSKTPAFKNVAVQVTPTGS